MNTSSPQKEPTRLKLYDHLLAIAIKRKNIIMPLISAICLSAGGGLFWMQKIKADEAAASIALSKDIALVKAGELDKAIEGTGGNKGLKTIIKTWGHTESGNMSRLYLATFSYDSGKIDEALAMYNNFNSKNNDLQAAAIAGAAACHVQKKAFSTAATEFEKASSTAENEALKSMYLKLAAENQDLAGQPDKAAQLLVKVIRTWPGSASAGMARRTLLYLEGKGATVPPL
ncbi:MAG: hypothetical protein HGA97_04385 [Chlorobiaceae bacterium]|nr:hypothetical protein [Chlorobiaceae bacterium]